MFKKIYKDLFSIIILLVISFTIAFNYTQQHPLTKAPFYFNYLEPSIMIACNKGFVRSNEDGGPQLQQFFALKAPSYTCQQIPKDLTVHKSITLQGWYYLLVTLGIFWKIFGISWHSFNLFLASLFAISIAASYGIFRLGMGWLLAVIAALLFCCDPFHLQYLTAMRDYSKAPSMLLAILCLGILVRYRLTKIKTILLVVLAGIIIGIGYGFRPDLLIMLPIFSLSILFFRPQLSKKQIPASIIYCLIFCLSFTLSAWPVLATGHQSADIGSCTWHFPLLGTTQPLLVNLGTPSYLYGWEFAFTDQEVYALVNAYGENFLHLNNIIPCSQLYDQVSAFAFKQLLINFPADFLGRFYSAIIHTLTITHALFPSIIFILTLVFLRRWRYALFFTCVVIYFFGYPSIYINSRHYFYLSFWQWWLVGFFVTQAYRLYKNKELRKEYFASAQPIKAASYRVIVFVLILIAIATLSLEIARAIQVDRVTRLIHSYQQAPRKPLLTSPQQDLSKKISSYKLLWPSYYLPTAQDLNGPAKYRAKMLHLQVGGKSCQQKIIPLTLKYKIMNSSNLLANIDYSLYYDYSQTLHIVLMPQQTFDVYMPAYFSSGDVAPRDVHAHGLPLQGAGYPYQVEIPLGTEACLRQINEIDTAKILPVWTEFYLPENWQEFPLYQTL